MGDTSLGAETSATGASTDEDSASLEPPSGFLSRVKAALSPKATPVLASTGATGAHGPTVPTPGLLNLRRMRVEDVAIPTADIVAVPLSSSKDELVEVFRASGLTRLPVFDGTLDSPLGFINMKDFALKHGFNGGGEAFSLTAMIRTLLFVPPSMPLGVLLQKMQADRTHMALVIDEYGGVDGLVTIEDLIEQVVGEIEDEHDLDEATTFAQEKPGVWLALAKTPLDEFEQEMGHDLRAHPEIDKEEVDTLGGLVTMLAGQLPVRGEVIAHPEGHEFEVIDADPRRIKRVRVRSTDATGA